jgi:GT2 family glycosyltransferase
MPHLASANHQTAHNALVSLLIPARNEARNIAHLLDGALQQTYPHWEIIVVDDDSTDNTPTILAAYGACHTRLRVRQGSPLPLGWTGKCYACQQAAAVAQGEWLLFLDADTRPQPALVASLVTHAQRHNLDMVSIFPAIELGSFWERVILPPFYTLLHAIFPFKRLNASHTPPNEVLANGQCILVRREAYDTVGGHGAVRGEVLDDVMLARVLRRAGFRTGAVLGLQELRVRMYTNGREVVEGLTKNAAAGFTSGGHHSLREGAIQFALALLPICLLVLGGIVMQGTADGFAWAVLGQGVVVVSIALSFWGIVLHRRYQLSPWYAFFWSFGLVCYGCIALRSWWKVQTGRGVLWKGRTYAGT